MKLCLRWNGDSSGSSASPARAPNLIRAGFCQTVSLISHISSQFVQIIQYKLSEYRSTKRHQGFSSLPGRLVDTSKPADSNPSPVFEGQQLLNVLRKRTAGPPCRLGGEAGFR